jgi:hypothetical protein
MIPLCLLCEHLIDASSCLAFPGGIPEEILDGKKSHLKSLPNDNGYQFKSQGKNLGSNREIINTSNNNNSDSVTKENARMVTRGVPLEENMQEDGNEILGSVVYDVVNVLKESKFFELKNEKE